jgi:hypothetical protein
VLDGSEPGGLRLVAVGVGRIFQEFQRLTEPCLGGLDIGL